MKLPTTKNLPNLQGELDKGGLDNLEYGITFGFSWFFLEGDISIAS